MTDRSPAHHVQTHHCSATEHHQVADRSQPPHHRRQAADRPHPGPAAAAPHGGPRYPAPHPSTHAPNPARPGQNPTPDHRASPNRALHTPSQRYRRDPSGASPSSLLPRPAPPGGSRRYTEPDVQRLLLERRMKPRDFSLEQSRELLEAVDVAGDEAGRR